MKYDTHTDIEDHKMRRVAERRHTDKGGSGIKKVEKKTGKERHLAITNSDSRSDDIQRGTEKETDKRKKKKTHR